MMSEPWNPARARSFLRDYAAGLLDLARGVSARAEDAARSPESMRELLAAAGVDDEVDEVLAESQLRRCRACGCTEADCRACAERTGVPCHWVEEDLCSACAPAEQALYPATLRLVPTTVYDAEGRHTAATVVAGDRVVFKVERLSEEGLGLLREVVSLLGISRGRVLGAAPAAPACEPPESPALASAAPSYPPGWPSCPGCGEPSLDGHLTCGGIACSDLEFQTSARPEGA